MEFSKQFKCLVTVFGVLVVLVFMSVGIYLATKSDPQLPLLNPNETGIYLNKIYPEGKHCANDQYKKFPKYDENTCCEYFIEMRCKIKEGKELKTENCFGSKHEEFILKPVVEICCGNDSSKCFYE